MSVLSDLRMLYLLSLAPVRGKTHSERLESFYRRQAGGYDAFRTRLLHGRESLIRNLPVPEGAVWVDLGGGTGSNLDAAADWLPRCREVHVVDLASSLLNVARERVDARGWQNVKTVQADARCYQPGEPADVVTFSYSLTMIPDWFSAIDHAQSLLKPGGVIGVVDFFVSRKYVPAGQTRHSWFTRNVLPLWFAGDNVHLSADHVPYLRQKFETLQYTEQMSTIPWLPLVRAPYYQFVGRKPCRGEG